MARRRSEPVVEVPPAALTEDVTTRVSPAMKERLRALAVREERSESWIMRAALRDYLDQREE